MARRWMALTAAVVLLAAGCDSDNGAASGDRPTSTRQNEAGSTTTIERVRAAARWERLTTFNGSGNESGLTVSLSPDVIQWRVHWTCETGDLRIEMTPTPRKPGPLVNARCPGMDEAFSTVADDVELRVEASAPWSLIVEQQVDTPLAEPPLAEMADAPVLREGVFHDLEKKGSGSARIYELPGGRRVLRLDDFSVSQNTDLFIWLSEAADPKTSAEAVAAPKVVLAELRSTIGSQNYEIPADLPTERIRSIVIWCVPVAVAYSVAPLVPPI